MSILKTINFRSFVSITIFLSFSVMLVTSILMFSRQHDTSTALVHTIIGFALLLIAFWHLKNNFRPLKQHFKFKTGQTASKVNVAMLLALSIFLVLVTLSIIQYAPFLSVYEWGNQLRAGDRAEPGEKLTYQKFDKSLSSSQGPKVTIDLRKGPYFAWPQYAFWVETLEGEFIQPLYVTSAIAKNNFTNKVTKKDKNIVFDSHLMFSGKVNPAEVFEFGEDPASKDERMRPESLPVFLHQLGKKNSQGNFVPAGSDLLSDAYTGATITENFLMKSQIEKSTVRKFKVLFEVNHSFDFNEYYSSDRFPDDLVYSGNGYSAQPSVIYQAIIDLDKPQKFYPMELVGRGHHSGQDGQIYQDMHNLTSALELIDRIIIEVEN